MCELRIVQSTEVLISDSSRSIQVLMNEKDQIEREQLTVAASMTALITKQVELAMKSRALTESIKKLMRA